GARAVGADDTDDVDGAGLELDGTAARAGVGAAAARAELARVGRIAVGRAGAAADRIGARAAVARARAAARAGAGAGFFRQALPVGVDEAVDDHGVGARREAEPARVGADEDARQIDGELAVGVAARVGAVGERDVAFVHRRHAGEARARRGE